MINHYVGTTGFNVSSIESRHDLLDVLDALHSMCMEECGAYEDSNKSSEQLKLMENILNLLDKGDL